MIAFPCEWIYSPTAGGLNNTCPDPGLHILIYGCLKQHIAETIFCRHHFYEWEVQAVDGYAWCPQDNCSEKTIAWEIVLVKDAKLSWTYKHSRKYRPLK